MKEIKTMKITFGKRGNGSYAPRLFLSLKDLQELDISPNERDIEYILDKDKKEIVIRKKSN